MGYTRLNCQKARKRSFPRGMNDESLLLPDISFRVKRPRL